MLHAQFTLISADMATSLGISPHAVRRHLPKQDRVMHKNKHVETLKDFVEPNKKQKLIYYYRLI